MDRHIKQFKQRFTSKLIALNPKLIDRKRANTAYQDYMYFVGNTSDGEPEVEATIFYYQGGV